MGNCFSFFQKDKEKDVENQPLTVDSSASTYKSTDSLSQSQAITDLKQELEAYKDKLKKSTALLKDRDDTIQSLSVRLSKEMSAKMAADESSVENVSIKARPMNIGEDYYQVCSNEWLEAKTGLDEKLPEGTKSERIKLELLCDIIKVAGSVASEYYIQKERDIQQFMDDYVHIKDEEGHSEIIVPQEMKNILGDSLRKTADDRDISDIYKEVVAEIDRQVGEDTEFKKGYSELWSTTKDDSYIMEYIHKMTRIGWKMAIQRPPMKFQLSSRWLGEKLQDLHWNSRADLPDAMVVTVYPMLYHNESLMAKGKVFLVDKNDLL